MSHTETIVCNSCGSEIDVDVRCTYGGRSASFLNPPEAPEFDIEVPATCPECGYAFTPEEQSAHAEAIDTKLSNGPDWWNDREEPEYDPTEEPY